MQRRKYISYEIKFIFATNMLSAPTQGIYFRRKADLPILHVTQLTRGTSKRISYPKNLTFLEVRLNTRD